MQAGAKRVDVREPIYTVLESRQVAKSEEFNLINGGMEEE